MKKSLILVGMLAVGYANAQTTAPYEGKVGVNTETPQATLEVLPSAKNAEATATTNEGIVAPKLTKARIANIAEANLVEGTLVYATDVTYTGTNTKVAKITEKGYYFYNGTEWVKASAGTNIYTSNGKLTENRIVETGNYRLNIEGNLWTPLVVNSKINPTDGNGSGGIAIHPNNMEKRVEVATTQDGDMRLWVGADRFFIKRETGRIGIGTDAPESRLHIVGGGDIDLTSRDKGALMLGAYETEHIIMDNNEIMARKNGNISVLALQTDGGDLTIGANLTDASKKYIFTDGKLGVGTFSPTQVLDVNGNAKFRALSGFGDRVVYVDADGVLKVGSEITASNGVQNTTGMQCNAENRGKMNFIPNDEGSDVFGICLRNKDGNYYWGYMVGGNNPTNGTGAFGSGL